MQKDRQREQEHEHVERERLEHERLEHERLQHEHDKQHEVHDPIRHELDELKQKL